MYYPQMALQTDWPLSGIALCEQIGAERRPAQRMLNTSGNEWEEKKIKVHLVVDPLARRTGS